MTSSSRDPHARLINVSAGTQVGYVGFGPNHKYFPADDRAKIQWTRSWGPPSKTPHS